MPIEVKRKEGESVNAFLYRFNKRVQQGGLIKEQRKRQFYKRTSNKQKRRAATLYRRDKQEEIFRLKKQGLR